MAEARGLNLVLASGSPFRRHMLEAAGVAVRAVPADVDEQALKQQLLAKKTPPPEIAAALARAKAEAVASSQPSALVVGADQVLAFAGEIFSKPVNIPQAREQLLRLCGQPHHLHTAVVLMRSGKAVWQHVETATLTMRAFSDAFLEYYLAAVGHEIGQSVGGYKIEASGIQLFEHIDGDYFSIIGLPLLPLLAELRRLGALAS